MKSFEKNYLKLGVIIIVMLAFFSLAVKSVYATEVSIDILDKLNNRVVAIGVKRHVLINEQGKQVSMNTTGKTEERRFFLGTGVLVKDLLGKKARNILVTAKHVVFEDNGYGKAIPDLYIWGNKKDGSEFEYPYLYFQELWPNVKWIKHFDSKVDIAISIVGFSDKDLIDFVPLKRFKEIANLNKGENVYYLGFPNGLGAGFGSNPVLRKGMVALNEKGKKFFYVDAVVTTGNSGGPVFSLENKIPKLLGIVTDFRSQRTEHGSFHSGLGRVFSADCIKDILKSPEFKDTY